MSLYSTLKRTPGTKRNGNNFSQAEVNAVWKKGTVLPERDSAVYRGDACGKIIQYSAYGNTDSLFGWEIDHIRPVSIGGSDDLFNLQPLYWRTNRDKSDSYPWRCK